MLARYAPQPDVCLPQFSRMSLIFYVTFECRQRYADLLISHSILRPLFHIRPIIHHRMVSSSAAAAAAAAAAVVVVV